MALLNATGDKKSVLKFEISFGILLSEIFLLHFCSFVFF